MNKFDQFPEYQIPAGRPFKFVPYEMNGGSIAAIAGDDFVIVAGDTRLSSGYTIHTRDQSKLFQLTGQTVLASCGCWCDTLSLTALIKARIQMYEHTHLQTMSTGAAAQMLSIMMYSKRFFPYYVSVILVGLDSDGKGAVYSYDPVGHCERSTYRAGGSSGPLLQPVLDNQIGFKNMNMKEEDKPKITREHARAVLTDAFISAAERDIYTGDAVIINIITKDGIEVEEVSLRKD